MKIGIFQTRNLEFSTVLHHFKDASKESNIDIVFYIPSNLLNLRNGKMSIQDSLEALGLPAIYDILCVRNVEMQHVMTSKKRYQNV